MAVIVSGRRDKQIALKLSISGVTAIIQRHHVKTKIQAGCSAELVRMAQPHSASSITEIIRTYNCAPRWSLLRYDHIVSAKLVWSMDDAELIGSSREELLTSVDSSARPFVSEVSSPFNGTTAQSSLVVQRTPLARIL